jgi:LPXTG-site transpeptidase (sortase) family protein
MRIRNLIITILLLGIAGVIFFFVQYSYQASKNIVPEYKQRSVGDPIQIIIPSIKVNALIEQVGQTPAGLMGVPEFANNVAWYKLGARPGEEGSAVIDGHVVGLNGEKGVFYDLQDLKPGDEIMVINNQTGVVVFVVQELRVYDPSADASTVFSSNDGKAHLNLITCQGPWDELISGYTQRLVVFADLIK